MNFIEILSLALAGATLFVGMHIVFVGTRRELRRHERELAQIRDDYERKLDGIASGFPYSYVEKRVPVELRGGPSDAGGEGSSRGPDIGAPWRGRPRTGAPPAAPAAIARPRGAWGPQRAAKAYGRRSVQAGSDRGGRLPEGFGPSNPRCAPRRGRF